MRLKIFFIVLLFGICSEMYSQEINYAEDSTFVQTVAPRVIDYRYLKDSLGVRIIAPDSMDAAMDYHIQRNMKKKNRVYRLRIFFDNSRNARRVSEEMKNDFTLKYGEIPIYRIYDNPYWKLTVGDFREKSDAMKLMDLLDEEYPSIFLVRETFSTI